MNGIHDMGGMHGMGPVQPEVNEPVFHAVWEGRVYAIQRALGPWRKWNIDTGRYYIELIPPAEYLRMSYYERWVTSITQTMIQHGVITTDELGRKMEQIEKRGRK